MRVNKGKNAHSLRILPALAVFFIAPRTAWTQSELPSPFTDIPVVDADGGEGNPAAMGFDPVREFALTYANDTTGSGSLFDAGTFGLAGRYGGFAAGVHMAFRNGDYFGDEARFSQALPLRILGSSLGAQFHYTTGNSSGKIRLGLDLGWQAAPLPQLRLGYYTRDLFGSGPKPQLQHRFAAGICPFGHRVGASGRLELGGGSEMHADHFDPYAFVRMPLGGALNLWGWFAPRGNRFSLGVSATLGTNSRLGIASGKKSVGIRWVASRSSTPRYVSFGRCARELDLNHPVSMPGMPEGWFGGEDVDLASLSRRFDFLEQDAMADVIVLRLGRMRATFATAEEIHDRILPLHSLGKHVFAYLDADVSPMNYLVASAADRIAVHPQGHFAVRGFSAEITFYKGLLDKIGVEAQFLRHGKSKSFAEPFTRTDLSPEARANLSELMESEWSLYLRKVSAARGIPEEKLRAWLARGEIDLDSAHAHGLIDTLLQSDEVAAAAMGSGTKACTEPAENSAGDPRWGNPEEVALIALNGEIHSGTSRAHGLFGGETMGAETAVALLRKVRGSRMRAVVLRLDSPGGMVQASDQIAREIDLLRRDGKKVVVSVGGTAASGAYYIACRADAIVAEPGSVVGSIGVLWGKVVTRGAYAKLGLTRDGVQTSPHADAVSSARPWTEDEIAVAQRELDRFYATFLDQVREGRRGKVKDLDLAAEGRVFTGIKAKELGLVDTLGGLDMALDLAAHLAGLHDWKSRRVERIYPQAEFHLFQPGYSLLGLNLGPSLPLDEIAAQLEEWEQPRLWALDPASMATGFMR